MPTQDHTHIESESLSFEPLPAGSGAGVVEHKPLSSPLLDQHRVSLLRLAPGAALEASATHDRELFVLSGTWTLPGGDLTERGYARLPADGSFANSSPTGCILFQRAGPFKEPSDEPLQRQTTPSDWVPGQGNLRVLPLHHGPTSGTALVHWPAGERFVPHRHFGGEEIFVLSGTFRDEHGNYPAGSWLLSPHLSTHHPFVTEETTILVKTGHLPVA